MVCLEVSPHLIKRAEAALEAAGLSGRVSVKQTDVTRGSPTSELLRHDGEPLPSSFGGLESVFEGEEVATPGGVFVTTT